MLIEFEKLQENLVPKPRGGEGEMYTRTFQDENNKIMQIRLTPGSHLGMHTHEVDSEAFYILSGTGKVLCDGVDENRLLHPWMQGQPVRDTGPGADRDCPWPSSGAL